MIDPFEMAKIYWRWLQGEAIYEVTSRIEKLSKTPQTKAYWEEVLTFLDINKNGRRIIN